MNTYCDEEKEPYRSPNLTGIKKAANAPEHLIEIDKELVVPNKEEFLQFVCGEAQLENVRDMGEKAILYPTNSEVDDINSAVKVNFDE